MPIGMHQVFEELQFEQFEHPLSSQPAYQRNFGPFEVQAVVFTNRWLEKVYLLGGTVKTDRTIASIEGDLPLEVQSREEGLALLSFFLAPHIPEVHKPAWLRIGERMKSDLPWMRKTRAAEAA